MKKMSGMFALLLAIPTPAKPVDVNDVIRSCVIGGAALLCVGTVGYLIMTAPYVCPGCSISLKNGEPYVEGSYCIHRFHVGHYAAGTTCQECLREKIFEESVCKATKNAELNTYNNSRDKDIQQARRAEREDLEYVRQLEREKLIAQQKSEIAWKKARQTEEDRKLAERIAQQESTNARGGYATPGQVKADQCEAHGQGTANKVAQEELRAQQQRDIQAAARRAQEQQERENNTRNRQASDREQATIRSTPWMMEECPICLAPRAQNGDVLVNLKDPKHKHHTTALPCGHVFHTTCIKEAAKHDVRCPLCRTAFEPRHI